MTELWEMIAEDFTEQELAMLEERAQIQFKIHTERLKRDFGQMFEKMGYRGVEWHKNEKLLNMIKNKIATEMEIRKFNRECDQLLIEAQIKHDEAIVQKTLLDKFLNVFFKRC